LMAQDFVGSNNINFFEPLGEFGSRLNNGEDASATRYIYTKPSQLLSYLLIEDDQDLLTHLVDENVKVEPETYLPILPNILINGAKGIGTGYSSYIPCHNPLDLMAWLRARLLGKVDLPTIKPWYRGFTGQIMIIDRRKMKDKLMDDIQSNINEDVNLDLEPIMHCIDEELADLDDEVNSQSDTTKPLLSFVVTGTYHVGKNNNIIVTELPIGVSPARYLTKVVKKMLEEKRIKKYYDKSDTDKIYFELKGYKGNPSFQALGLRRRYSLSNMVLLDKHNTPIRYDTANDIMETFYTERFPYFQQRKEHKLLKIKTQLTKLTDTITFTNAILNKDLIVHNVSKLMIYEKLKQLSIPQGIYDSAKLSDMNKEEITLLNNKMDILQKEYTTLEKTTASELWLNDIALFDKKYKSIYPV